MEDSESRGLLLMEPVVLEPGDVETCAWGLGTSESKVFDWQLGRCCSVSIPVHSSDLSRPPTPSESPLSSLSEAS